eukprot:4168403-Amphidinium_carterae.1
MSSRMFLGIVDTESLSDSESLSSLCLLVVGSMPVVDGPGAIVLSTAFCVSSDAKRARSSFSANTYSGRTAIVASECLTVAKGLIVEPK